MIPVRLEFAAFGPFPEKQVIDFTRFDDSRIFLITGPTGSGKTTIFDVLTYSLYGRSSGSLRDKNTLKSDYVGDSGLCYAEFTFLIHGKRYTVRRTPTQRCPNKRGNDVKTQLADALLSDENGVICSHVTPVDSKIEELLGLSYEQFRKIVLLPQGEFRRFLSDSSDAKQEILRRIFFTDLLGRFTDLLRQNVSALETDYRLSLSQCTAYLKTVQPAGNNALADLLDAKEPDFSAILPLLTEQNQADEAQLRETESALNKARAQYDALNLDLAKKENDLLTQYRQAAAQFAEMETHNEEWSKRRETIALLDKITPAAQKEQLCMVLAADLNRLMLEQDAAKAVFAEQKTAAGQCEKAFILAKEKADKSQALAEQIRKLRTLAERLAELSEKQKTCTLLEDEREKKRRMLKALAEAKLYTAAKTECEAVQGKKAERERFFDTLESYRLTCTQAAISAKQAADALSAYIAAQAPLLAKSLRDNEPCPVCGATVHPAPAQAHSIIGSKEAYEQAQRREAADASRRERLLQELSYLLSEENRGNDPLACIEAEQRLYESLSAEYKTRRAALAAFRIPDKLKQYTAEEMETALNRYTEQVQQLGGRLFALFEQCDILQRSIPRDADAQSLSVQIASCEAQIAEADKQLQNAVSAREKAQLALVRTETQLKGLAEQLVRKQAEQSSTEEEYARLLEQSGLSEEGYRALLPLLPELESRREALHAYKLDYRSRRDLVQSLKEQTAGLKPHDITALQEKKQTLLNAQNELQQRCNQKDRVLNANRRAQKLLCAQIRRESDLRAELERVRFLYGVSRGDLSGKVNFERYVLAYYFENVIQNANIRLEQMTNSRYTLIRRTQSEGHNRTSGLELDVFDAYTGLSRHVDTLSGGESFKVSLALALGLADIISETSGGIELNTMLIDEGFGSLDSDSLDMAIGCLCDLRASGRYIGIISHVNELKERIPQHITVTQSVNGSMIQEDSI